VIGSSPKNPSYLGSYQEYQRHAAPGSCWLGSDASTGSCPASICIQPGHGSSRASRPSSALNQEPSRASSTRRHGSAPTTRVPTTEKRGQGQPSQATRDESAADRRGSNESTSVVARGDWGAAVSGTNQPSPARPPVSYSPLPGSQGDRGTPTRETPWI
jgi:hypothetical protein